ncbi:MAG: Ig-like domain-containing protein [Bacteroidales bacterium]|nr:Ig-like domain-containing protein [Bacteroidales bacterium]
MKRITALALLALLGWAGTEPSAAAKVKLHSIGDSTMQTYDESTDKRGWGQMLQQFFDSDYVTVNNRGKSGASSKSFYLESAYWPTMVAEKSSSTTIEEGDFLIIQFAHNDEKNQGMDGDSVKAYYTAQGDATTASATDYRGTTAYGTFKKYIRAYIDECKARGGKPVIVTPICRKYFSGTTAIRRNGMHDLGDSFSKLTESGILTGQSVPSTDNTYDYAQALIDVAAEYEDVPVIDITQLTAEMYVKYGEAFCTASLFCSDDSTHPIAMGATLIARAFAQAVKNGDNMITKAANYNAANKSKSDAVLAELAEHVVVSNEISFNPVSGNLGKAYSGQTLTKEFSVSAFGMANATGTVSISTDGAFTVSTDKQNFGSSVEVAYTGSTLITTVYVRATLSGSGTVTGTMTATDGINSKSLELSADVVSLAGGEAEECSVLWAMNGGNSYVTEGSIEGIDQTWSNMYARDYNNINASAVWPEGSGYDATRKTQRNCTPEDSWPSGEIDEVSTRYIQFGVRAPEKTVINIDRISMYVAGAGGSGMRCKVYYSLDSLFSQPVQIADFSGGMAGNTALEVNADVVESIEDGEPLYMRIYPWYNGGAANAKTICLADVCVHGYAQAASSSVSIDGATVTWGLHKAGTEQEVTFEPFEASAYFTEPTVTAGSSISFNGTSNWSGTDTENNGIVMAQIGNGTDGTFLGSVCDEQSVTFTTKLTNGGVFIPSALSLNAARLGTDGGSFTVFVGAGNDEQEVISGQLPNRNGKSQTLSQYAVDVSGLAADEENPLHVRIALAGQGKGKYYAFSDLTLTGTVMGAADDESLAVLSAVPDNGTTDLSRSGKIVINYNKRIAQGSGTATLTNIATGASADIAPTWSNRALTFNYVGLDYGTSYRIDIPKGYVTDAATGSKQADALEYNFTVLSRPVPAARTFNAIVDASLTDLAIKDGKIEATADMPAQYRSIQAAINDAPSNSTEPYLIYIRNGYYNHPNFTFNTSYGTRYTDMTSNTGTETTKIDNGAINAYDSCRIIYINKPNIHLIGQERDGVIIATDRLAGSVASDHSKVWYHINAAAAVQVQTGGTDFYMGNLTVDNENWTLRKMAGPQCLCFNIQDDRAVLNNVRARSYQDTYYNGGTYNRTFWYNSEIEGAVDFIYGASDVWFEGCTLNINRPSGGFIVAPNHPADTRWGYVFNNCRITTDDVADPSKYSIWLGRPWHEKPKTVFLHTQMELTPMDSLWYATMGGLPALWAVYDFYNAKGNALSTVSRSYYYYTSNGTTYGANAKNYLTDEEAAEYTLNNVMAGDGSANASGYWTPQTYVDKPQTPLVMKAGTEVTWTADKYAVCYVVHVNGKPVAFPTECRYVAQMGDVVSIQSVGEHGSLSDMSESLTIDGGTSSLREITTTTSTGTTIYDIEGRKSSATRGFVIRNGRAMLNVGE